MRVHLFEFYHLAKSHNNPLSHCTPPSSTSNQRSETRKILTADVELPVGGDVLVVGGQGVAGGAPQEPVQVGHGGGELEDALGHVSVHRGALMTSL